jgi:hypothetical protein
MMIIRHLTDAALGGTFVDDNFQDLSILAKILFASQSRQQFILSDTGV